MSSERQTKIGFLSRASKGKAVQQSFLAALSAIADCTVTPEMLTSLEERDLVLEDFRKGYREAKNATAISFSKGYRAENKEAMFKIIACFADRLEERSFLITKESEFCGAVELEGTKVLRHCAEILELDGDAVMVLSKDHEQGLLLDFDPDNHDNYYDLTVWGSKWPVMILGCSR